MVVAAGTQAQRPDAAALAARIDHHYNSLHSLRVGFTQRYAGMGMDRVERGTLLIERGGRMRWDYTEPAGKLLVVDGPNAYFYAPGQAEAQRIPAKQLSDLQSPLRFLLGQTHLAREISGLHVVRQDAAANGQAGFTLEGVPKGLERRVSSLQITADSSGAICSMRIEETHGVTNIFEFSAEQPNAPVPADAFVFRAPEGVHIVDGLPPV